MRWMKWLPSLIVLIGLQSRGATVYVSPLGDVDHDVAKKATVGIWRDQRDMAIEMGE